MGIAFSDHPDLKRIFLWEGFPGHPLRKDFLALPGGYKPGLQRFPFEFPAGQRNYAQHHRHRFADRALRAAARLDAAELGARAGRHQRCRWPARHAWAAASRADGPTACSGRRSKRRRRLRRRATAPTCPTCRRTRKLTPKRKARPSDIEQAPPDARPGANA